MKKLPHLPEMEDDKVLRLLSEGGKEFLDFLMACHITNDGIPVTFKDIKEIPIVKDRHQWVDACLEELKSLQKRNVYELVDLPEGRKAIKNRWVFNVKSDGWKRARLVAKGFSQIEGIDFDKLFSPVVRYETT
jgi:hypothetical protein